MASLSWANSSADGLGCMGTPSASSAASTSAGTCSWSKVMTSQWRANSRTASTSRWSPTGEDGTTCAAAASGAKTEAEAAAAVKETLEAQREALSGVSLDEEAVNLMRQQRAFQGAARLVAAVDELMQTVLNLV